MNKSISPSWTYVAVCNKQNFDGYYFRKFTLPKEATLIPSENNSDFASWYYLNYLDGMACISGCFSFEEYSNVTEHLVEKNPEKDETEKKINSIFDLILESIADVNNKMNMDKMESNIRLIFSPLGKSVEEIDKSTKEFVDSLNKSFHAALSNSSEKAEENEPFKSTLNWTEALDHVHELLNLYVSLLGNTQVNPMFSIGYLRGLIVRYNNGERTKVLYNDMMSCE